MSTVKIFKKGEILFREGESAKTVYLIQSGSVNLHLSRQKQTIDLCMIGAQQIVGEHALTGAVVHPHSAVCASETKVIELPVEAVKTQIEASSQLNKVLTKGLTDKLKVVFKELQSVKLDRDNTPCPVDQTAKIFASLYHAVRLKGSTTAEGVVTASWPAVKQYAQRMFLESPKRLEQAANIFVKLGNARYEWVKNEDEPDAPEELGFIHFTDLDLVEQFFEFYQYYYFKGGKAELLKTDDRVMQLTAVLIELGRAETPDRNGVVKIEYTKLVEKVKEAMSLQLNPDHFTLLENKGLFVKRQSTDNGVFIHFELKEFMQSSRVWRVLREVERWNEKGSVDPNEVVNEGLKAKKISVFGDCSKCNHPHEEGAKFCSECGTKVVAAA